MMAADLGPDSAALTIGIDPVAEIDRTDVPAIEGGGGARILTQSAPHGESRIGLYQPDQSTFHLKDEFAPGAADHYFGYGPWDSGWTPLVGDWNGDGIDTVGLYEPGQSLFHLKDSFTTGASDQYFAFGPSGHAGWIPLAGDWDGDGIDTIGLYDPAAGLFHLKNSFTPGASDIYFAFGPSGNAGWQPMVGDWDGDGADTIGLYQGDISLFHLKDTFTGGPSDHYFAFGPAGSQGWSPLSGDWNGDGVDTIGLYQSELSLFHLKDSFTPGASDQYFAFGPAGNDGWVPLSGDWNGAAQPEPTLFLDQSRVSENNPGAAIGMLSVSGVDSQRQWDFEVADPRFEVVDGTLKLRQGVSLDHESGDRVRLQVTAQETNGSGIQIPGTLEIQVSDVNEAPSLATIADQVFAPGDDSLRVDLLAGDIDGDELIYDVKIVASCVPLEPCDDVPADYRFEGNTLVMTPRADFFGQFTVEVGVSDGELHASSVFEVVIDAQPLWVDDDKVLHINTEPMYRDLMASGITDLSNMMLMANVLQKGDLISVEVGYYDQFSRQVLHRFEATRDDFSKLEFLGSAIGDELFNSSSIPAVAYGFGGNDFLWGFELNGYEDHAIPQVEFYGGEGNDYLAGWGTLYGGPGDDYFQGSEFDDLLYGEGGADTLYGFEGDDLLVGGEGPDQLFGGGGNDMLEDNMFGTIQFLASNGTLFLFGQEETNDSAEVRFEGNEVVASLVAGNGIPVETRLQAADVQRIEFWGYGGDDSFVNATSIRSVGYGGLGADTLRGGAADDVLWGEGGPDSIFGGGGADFLYGGTEVDYLDGGDGDDTLSGDEGNDELHGGNGADQIRGGIGDDLVRGGNGDDTIEGGDGNDTLDGGAGADLIGGGAGDDYLAGGFGNDRLMGDGGRDSLRGEAGMDSLWGGQDDDWLYGGADADFLDGDAGNDALYGNDGNDEIFGDLGNDILDGGAGDDQLHGGDGHDQLLGGLGDDRLYGGSGDDLLRGGDAHDWLFGGLGNDDLYGDAGDDRLYGESGNDYLEGASGLNLIDGGSGANTNEPGRPYFDGNGVLQIIGDAGNNSVVLSQGYFTRDLNLELLKVKVIGKGEWLFKVAGLRQIRFDGGAGNDILVTVANPDEADATVSIPILAFGGDGDDYLEGGDARDELHGGRHNDKLFGKDNKDRLYGDTGTDYLYGGRHSDELRGGSKDGTRFNGEVDYLDGESGNDIYPELTTVRKDFHGTVFAPALWGTRYIRVDAPDRTRIVSYDFFDTDKQRVKLPIGINHRKDAASRYVTVEYIAEPLPGAPSVYRGYLNLLVAPDGIRVTEFNNYWS